MFQLRMLHWFLCLFLRYLGNNQIHNKLCNPCTASTHPFCSLKRIKIRKSLYPFEVNTRQQNHSSVLTSEQLFASCSVVLVVIHATILTQCARPVSLFLQLKILPRVKPKPHLPTFPLTPGLITSQWASGGYMLRTCVRMPLAGG